MFLAKPAMNNTDCKYPKLLRRAFTLIEILIVIALTAVLFALLIIPLVSALNYTRQAQLVTAAQDAARSTRERITRELSSAVFVFDGTSHPFQVPAGTTPNPGDDRYTNFLDLQILDKNATKQVVAHAYNAKLDFVLPKLNDNGGTATVDPTTNDPIAYTQSQNGSAIISNPSLVFPLAAGTTMVRCFVGLKNPAISYNNTREGKTNGTSSDNTYILFRAQFLPYKYDTSPGPNKPAVSANTDLFAVRPKLDANNAPVKDKFGNIIYIPELDDPDFFRYVTTNDVNWLNDAHSPYTAAEVAAHNGRVDKWQQISKALIPGPNVDLLLLPHNADNTLAYETIGTTSGVCTASVSPVAVNCLDVAHSGVAHDPVQTTGGYYPIVNTSVTFRPATVSGNATPGTTSDYNSSGVVSFDQSGFTYIPTVYTATSQSWSLPFHVSLYPGNTGAANASMYTYDTDQFAAAQTAVLPAGSGINLNPGDIIEYKNDGVNPRAPVYNVTQGYPFTYDGTNYTSVPKSGDLYVPMTVNPDAGTISFAAPSLPGGPTNRSLRQWSYAVAADPNNPASSVVDLTQPGFTDATLATPNTNLSPLTVTNAHPVPGSVRVYGLDTVDGPNKGNQISYNEVSAAVNDVGQGQYAVDYTRNTLRLDPKATGPIQVIYDYQANMTLTDNTKPFSFSQPSVTDNLYQPMQVKVDYQTRDLIDVNIGVRIYDVSTNRAQVIPTETKIKIGNSNR